MKKIHVHRARSLKDAEAFDVRFWRRAGAAARFEAAWAMVGEFLKMRGKPRAQLRLRRSVQHIGMAPVRVDILSGLPGVTAEEAWKHRKRSRYGRTTVHILGRDELIRAKKATGRPQDQLDLRKLLRGKERGRR